MPRTTPPRPVDVTTIAPGIAAFARTTLRLHPRHGAPTVHTSSLGGPLLWPAGEPWPVCSQPHPRLQNPLMRQNDMTDVRTISSERRIRELLRDIAAAGHKRTPEQQEEYLRLSSEMIDQEHAPEEPVPMLPILQLYLSDAHGVVDGPGGADLVQVHWCPFDHEPESMPVTRITWRTCADLGAVLETPPEPEFIQHGHYLPNVCVLHPEPVTEYPPRLLLPDAINEQLTTWMKSDENRLPVVYDEERMAAYQYVLSVAPGCKVGGWAPVSFRHIKAVDCPSCGVAMTPFLYIDSSEWDGGTYPWRPIEDFDGVVDPRNIPRGNGDDEVGIQIGRGYGMQIYTCPADFDHPHVEIMQ